MTDKLGAVLGMVEMKTTAADRFIQTMSYEAMQAALIVFQDAGLIPSEPNDDLVLAAGRLRVVLMNVLSGMTADEATEKVSK